MARRHFPQSLFAESLFAEPPTLVISCDDCVMVATDACRDCVVPLLLGDDEAAPAAGVDLDADEAVTLRLLQQAGLAPELRHPRHTPLLSVLGGRA